MKCVRHTVLRDIFRASSGSMRKLENRLHDRVTTKDNCSQEIESRRRHDVDHTMRKRGFHNSKENFLGPACPDENHTISLMLPT